VGLDARPCRVPFSSLCPHRMWTHRRCAGRCLQSEFPVLSPLPPAMVVTQAMRNHSVQLWSCLAPWPWVSGRCRVPHPTPEPCPGRAYRAFVGCRVGAGASCGVGPSMRLGEPKGEHIAKGGKALRRRESDLPRNSFRGHDCRYCLRGGVPADPPELGAGPCSWGQGMPLGRKPGPSHRGDHTRGRPSEAIDRPGPWHAGQSWTADSSGPSAFHLRVLQARVIHGDGDVY
jgi:hypothetical protein